MSLPNTKPASVSLSVPVDSNSPDRIYSRAALDQATLGKGLVSPNPLVGCVILSADDRLVGRAYYTFDGVTHAELLALEQAGTAAQGGTAYVSLEPHSHHGRTPPCTEALIEAGIKRVVAPIEDPNPLVSGRGFERLREAGVEVITGILADEATKLNEKFICWHKKGRPFVHLKLAMSLDGRVSLNKSVSTALSGVEAKSRVHDLRHEFDAILVGGNTVFVDDPSLTDRSGKARRRQLVRVILDNRLRLSSESHLAKTATDVPTVVFTELHDPEHTEPLREIGIDVIELDGGGRDIGRVLRKLAELEIQSLLVEGGTEIAGAFCDARLVDKITLIGAPLIIGGQTAPMAIGGRGATALADAIHLNDISVERLGDDIEITGYPTAS